jgi:predicted NAD/FAD-binding protein
VRIAVIGGGVSGNLCARLLAVKHDVQLFEANEYAGGHTNTVRVSTLGGEYPVDTGFMVFNDRTYPHFTKLLELLDVPSQASDMSFSVRSDRPDFEFQGSSVNGLFAQRSNLVKPSFYRMLAEVLRFNRESPRLLETDDDHLTIGEYVERERYGRQFVECYLVPMGAAIWSSRPDRFEEFPARFLIGFLRNHGLLQLRDRPVWKTIPGGARRYVDALLRPLGDRVRLSTPIDAVRRHADHVVVTPRGCSPEQFDQVVFATHADQTLSLLADSTPVEREILGHFPYQTNEAVLHTDASLLPRRRRAWASWNYYIADDSTQPATVTYDVNRLQRLGATDPICVSLNPQLAIDPAKTIARFSYDHPVFRPGATLAQRRHAEISGRNRTHFCGAYWRYGFHEDGVRSALSVCGRFGIDLEAVKLPVQQNGSVAPTTPRAAVEGTR